MVIDLTTAKLPRRPCADPLCNVSSTLTSTFAAVGWADVALELSKMRDIASATATEALDPDEWRELLVPDHDGMARVGGFLIDQAKLNLRGLVDAYNKAVANATVFALLVGLAESSHTARTIYLKY